MDVTYKGNTTFYIKGKKASVALNPTKDTPQANVVLSSTDASEDVKADQVIDWPGEYEVSEILVHGISAPHGESQTTLFQFEVDNVKFLFLPNLDHVLGDEALDKIGDVDVVLLPVGGNGVLDAKLASKVYESIEQVEFKKENGRALTSGSKVKIEDTEDTKIIKYSFLIFLLEF